MQKRPTLVEIAAHLHRSGNPAAGDVVAASANVNAVQLEHRLKAMAKPTKYVREKNRSAYLYLRDAGLDLDKQKDVLSALVDRLRKQAGLGWMPATDSEGALLVLVLPANQFVAAYKMPLKEYQKSGLPALVAESSQLTAYLRKPRADVQHLATAVTAAC